MTPAALLQKQLVIAGTTPRILVMLGVAVGALAACGSSQPPATPGVVRVVAGENFWGNIAAQIGGRHVRVSSILTSPTTDPHLYESDVADAVTAAEAGLVIQNGADYDEFLSQLLGATRHQGRVVVTVPGHAPGGRSCARAAVPVSP
jgi:zinc/manganese transport system substrate-binding protein